MFAADMKNIRFLSFLCALCVFFGFGITAYATEEERMAIPIESNAVPGWPRGPATGARAAIVIEAESGVILYAKNIHERLYPASTTKLMTCLVAIEHASLTDTVTFSRTAVDAVPYDGSRIGIEAGEALTMEEALYGIMVGSGNEVANAVAEHVAGSMDAFVDLMNARCAEMGLTDTHFTNANGLHDPQHYTTAYDLAQIGRAFFDSVTLSEIGGTASYHFTPTETQPDDFVLRNKHQLITGAVAVDGVIGGKTGFTDEAGECLVTCAQREGMKLISVVLFEDSPMQFTDSASLLEYGFHNFERIRLFGREDLILPDAPDYFFPTRSLFDRELPSLHFAQDDALLMPVGADLADANVTVSGPPAGDGETLAVFSYDWSGIDIGTVHVQRALQSASLPGDGRTPLVIDLRILALVLVAGALGASLLIAWIRHIVIVLFGKESRRRRRNMRRRKRNSARKT